MVSHNNTIGFSPKSGSMRKLLQTGAALAAFSLMLILSACGSSTSVVNSWKDPSTGPLTFKKVLVIYITKDQSSKRSAEDAIVAEIKKAQGVPAYSILTEDDTHDVEKAKARLKDMGFDGAVTMRVISAQQQSTYVPGSYAAPYHSFYGYYGYGYGAVYDPGYLRTDNIVRVESNVFSLLDDKLVWSGQTSTMNPDSAPNLAVDVARACVYEMKSQGLIK